MVDLIQGPDRGLLALDWKTRRHPWLHRSLLGIPYIFSSGFPLSLHQHTKTLKAELGRKHLYMPNSFTQFFLQFVFAVSHRQCLIPREHKEELHKYIGDLVKRRGCKPLAIHCVPDHAHIFIGYKPVKPIPDLVKEIKVESNQFINKKKWTPYHFSWQEGYGGFSYSKSDISKVINYIDNQEQHHLKFNFRSEYKSMLVENEIDFNDIYLFEFFD